MAKIQKVVVAGFGTNVSVELERHEDGDHLKDDGSTVEDFHPLHFDWSGHLPLNVGRWAVLEAELRVVVDGHPVSLGTIPLTTETIIHTDNWKNCEYQHKGSLGEHCTVYRTLHELCLVFRFENNTSKVKRVTGCRSNGFVPTVLDSAVYSTVHVPRNEPTPPGPKGFTGIDLTLTARSEEDPYLFAETITDGTGKFGDTKAERVAGAWSAIAVGLVILLIEGFLLWAFCTESACFAPPHPARGYGMAFDDLPISVDSIPEPHPITTTTSKPAKKRVVRIGAEEDNDPSHELEQIN
eukprot:Sspe_Gene.58999::Locus_32403_Transcript_1_1_Confidence_1.000_Length_1366::g.58999::m.58999